MRSHRNQQGARTILHGDERALCEVWLGEIDFLVPGRDDELWGTIQDNWTEFISLSTRQPSSTLPLYQRLSSRRGHRESETLQQTRERLHLNRVWRRMIDKCFRQRMDEYEANTEKWPVSSAGGTDIGEGSALVSLVASRDAEARRQYQAIFTSMVSFLAYSHQNSLLRPMGLKLDYSRRSDISLLIASVPDRFGSDPVDQDFSYLWDRIEGIMRWSIDSDQNKTPRNDPLLWWTAVLVRAAVSVRLEEEEISNIGDDRNPLPMGLGIREQLDAIIHCYKVFILNKSYEYWSTCPKDAGVGQVKVATSNNRVVNWLEGVKGRRLHARRDPRSCPSDSWPELLSKLNMDLDDCLGPHEETPLGKIQVLERDLALLAARRQSGTRTQEDYIDDFLFGEP